MDGTAVVPRPNHEVRPHPTLYYPTGDIVLLSLPHDGIKTAFKVDRVFLARASPVFETMLTLPPGPDVDMYDGVPSVQMQDMADQLGPFLIAFYDFGRSIPTKKHQADTVKRVQGVLALATKYDVDILRQRIVELLQGDWPASLEDWESAHEERKAIVTGARSKPSKNKHISEIYGQAAAKCLPDPCSAISLASSCNVPSILPAAFYDLSKIAGMVRYKLWDGDGNHFGNHTADLQLLSHKDFIRLTFGRKALSQLFIYRHHNIKTDVLNHLKPEHSCDKKKEPVTCAEQFKNLQLTLENNVLCQGTFLELDNVFESIMQDSKHTVCAQVHHRYKPGLLQLRTELWRRLPEFFGLREGYTPWLTVMSL
ncbi:hypothetical protein M422DRAFT_208903 [Sphaerobolus stellatus SS14]|uniref:BTB domain-containing protein n=1 Tax=Sphaerobolus stellatus (strain SS14) TaxID=990650 RepID=A0A0C9VVV1_SPHS4|nr:hypothetical protein M422DRAFT_208903 [Sphaerobolus stellatus SS14]